MIAVCVDGFVGTEATCQQKRSEDFEIAAGLAICNVLRVLAKEKHLMSASFSLNRLRIQLGLVSIQSGSASFSLNRLRIQLGFGVYSI